MKLERDEFNIKMSTIHSHKTYITKSGTHIKLSKRLNSLEMEMASKYM